MTMTAEAGFQGALFTEAHWNRLSLMIAEAYRLTAEERGRFRRSRIARLVAAIPYLAGCDDAERTALAHLSTLVLASRPSTRKAFDHAPSDDPDPMNRLRTISSFKGGNPDIIKKGMLMLCCAMLRGYIQDADADHAAGDYNPYVRGAWRETKVDGMEVLAASIPMPEMDSLMSGFEGEPGWWDL